MSNLAALGQIWQDDCYYLDKQSGGCKRKYVLILAVEAKTGDCVTVVFTSTPNGLPEQPTCYLDNPRSGFYLGIPGGVLQKETWLDFNSLETLDSYDLNLHTNTGRKILLEQTLPQAVFCAALRCVMQRQEDIPKREYSWLGDTVAALNCPYC